MSYLGKLGLLLAAMPFHAFFGILLMSSATVIGGDYYRSISLPFVPDMLADQRGRSDGMGLRRDPDGDSVGGAAGAVVPGRRPRGPPIRPQGRLRQRRRTGRAQRAPRPAGPAKPNPRQQLVNQPSGRSVRAVQEPVTQPVIQVPQAFQWEPNLILRLVLAEPPVVCARPITGFHPSGIVHQTRTVLGNDQHVRTSPEVAGRLHCRNGGKRVQK